MYVFRGKILIRGVRKRSCSLLINLINATIPTVPCIKLSTYKPTSILASAGFLSKYVLK